MAYEVFADKRADVTLLAEMVKPMEEKHGQAGRVWGVDRGIASDANLQWLRERGALYLVGTPRVPPFRATLNRGPHVTE